LERDDIFELARYATDAGLKVVVASCGYLINEQSLSALKKAGVLGLSLSIDGSAEETHDYLRGAKGAFESTVAAAEIAKKVGFRFQINTTISKVNIDEVAGIAVLAQRLGAHCFNAFILVPTGRGEQLADMLLDPVEYETLLHELLDMKLSGGIEVRVTCGPQFARICEQRKARRVIGPVNGCMGGRGFGFVSYSGEVQTCGFLDISAGNLVENGFDFGTIWTESEYLKKIRDVSNYSGKCSVCDYGAICGGCRARAFAACGDFVGSDPVCGYKKPKAKK